MQLLLGLAAGVEALQAASVEDGRVDVPLVRLVALGDQADQVVEVLNAFAGAEVDAEARAIDLASLSSRPASSSACWAAAAANRLLTPELAQRLGVVDEAAEVEVLHLGGERRREAAGVEAA